MAAPAADDERVQDVSDSQTTRLLRLGIEDTNPVVGNLTYRLYADDGDEWFRETLERATGLSLADLIAGRVEICRIEALKNEGKMRFASSGSYDKRLRGTLCYFVAVALAMGHYGVLISSRSAQGLSIAFLDIGSELPEAWAELLGRVALSLENR